MPWISGDLHVMFWILLMLIYTELANYHYCFISLTTWYQVTVEYRLFWLVLSFYGVVFFPLPIHCACAVVILAVGQYWFMWNCLLFDIHALITNEINFTRQLTMLLCWLLALGFVGVITLVYVCVSVCVWGGGGGGVFFSFINFFCVSVCFFFGGGGLFCFVSFCFGGVIASVTACFMLYF